MDNFCNLGFKGTLILRGLFHSLLF